MIENSSEKRIRPGNGTYMGTRRILILAVGGGVSFYSEFPRSLYHAQWEFFPVIVGITQEEDIIEKKLVNLPQLPLYIA